ncbi:hypothetical protein BS47DRAFT_1416635 [Hydnum rufescens UP504]|uniref:Uncharacterized protein n=1 Tax=Hydnum rufescens UP504 TaxID=1448309 RepID=A0A9P6AMD2_9AGAM|nr:hypothetical protein BS47DRAFT_1416635 [Hydnum rufescens UP504]
MSSTVQVPKSFNNFVQKLINESYLGVHWIPLDQLKPMEEVQRALDSDHVNALVQRFHQEGLHNMHPNHAIKVLAPKDLVTGITPKSRGVPPRVQFHVFSGQHRYQAGKKYLSQVAAQNSAAGQEMAGWLAHIYDWKCFEMFPHQFKSYVVSENIIVHSVLAPHWLDVYKTMRKLQSAPSITAEDLGMHWSVIGSNMGPHVGKLFSSKDLMEVLDQLLEIPAISGEGDKIMKIAEVWSRRGQRSLMAMVLRQCYTELSNLMKYHPQGVKALTKDLAHCPGAGTDPSWENIIKGGLPVKWRANGVQRVNERDGRLRARVMEYDPEVLGFFAKEAPFAPGTPSGGSVPTGLFPDKLLLPAYIFNKSASIYTYVGKLADVMFILVAIIDSYETALSTLGGSGGPLDRNRWYFEATYSPDWEMVLSNSIEKARVQYGSKPMVDEVFQFIFDTAELRDWRSQFRNSKVNELGVQAFDRLLSTSVEWWTLVGMFVPASLRESTPDERLGFTFESKVFWKAANPRDVDRLIEARATYRREIAVQQGRVNSLHEQVGRAANAIELAEKDLGTRGAEGSRLIEEAKVKAAALQQAAEARITAQHAAKKRLEKELASERIFQGALMKEQFPLGDYSPAPRTTGASADDGGSLERLDAVAGASQDMRQVEEDLYAVDGGTVQQLSNALKQALELHIGGHGSTQFAHFMETILGNPQMLAGVCEPRGKGTVLLVQQWAPDEKIRVTWEVEEETSGGSRGQKRRTGGTSLSPEVPRKRQTRRRGPPKSGSMIRDSEMEEEGPRGKKLVSDSDAGKGRDGGEGEESEEGSGGSGEGGAGGDEMDVDRESEEEEMGSSELCVNDLLATALVVDGGDVNE